MRSWFDDPYADFGDEGDDPFSPQTPAAKPRGFLDNLDSTLGLGQSKADEELRKRLQEQLRPLVDTQPQKPEPKPEPKDDTSKDDQPEQSPWLRDLYARWGTMWDPPRAEPPDQPTSISEAISNRLGLTDKEDDVKLRDRIESTLQPFLNARGPVAPSEAAPPTLDDIGPRAQLDRFGYRSTPAQPGAYAPPTPVVPPPSAAPPPSAVAPRPALAPPPPPAGPPPSTIFAPPPAAAAPPPPTVIPPAVVPRPAIVPPPSAPPVSRLAQPAFAPPGSGNPLDTLGPRGGVLGGYQPTPAQTEATPDIFQTRLARVQQRMADEGFPVTVVSGTRSAEQQAALYAKGRDTPGKIVTNADGTKKLSSHQSGLAADLAFVVNGKPSFAENNPWDTLGKIAREEGLVWGGDWKTLVDRPHVQLGATVQPGAIPPKSPTTVAPAQGKSRVEIPATPAMPPTQALDQFASQHPTQAAFADAVGDVFGSVVGTAWQGFTAAAGAGFDIYKKYGTDVSMAWRQANDIDPSLKFADTVLSAGTHVVAAASAVIPAYGTAMGEMAFGAMPGHEKESNYELNVPQFPFPLPIGRLAAHAKMILSGHAGDVMPVSIPGAVFNPPDSVTASGRVRSQPEMVALQVGINALDMAAKALTDPVFVGTVFLGGEATGALAEAPLVTIPDAMSGPLAAAAGHVLGLSFMYDGLKQVAATAAIPNVTPAQVFTSWLNFGVMAVPAAFHWAMGESRPGAPEAEQARASAAHAAATDYVNTQEQNALGTLGLTREQAMDPNAVRSAYRAKARETHPDFNPNDPRAAENFRGVNDAYQWLTDNPPGGAPRQQGWRPGGPPPPPPTPKVPHVDTPQPDRGMRYDAEIRANEHGTDRPFVEAESTPVSWAHADTLMSDLQTGDVLHNSNGGDLHVTRTTDPDGTTHLAAQFGSSDIVLRADRSPTGEWSGNHDWLRNVVESSRIERPGATQYAPPPAMDVEEPPPTAGARTPPPASPPGTTGPAAPPQVDAHSAQVAQEIAQFEPHGAAGLVNPQTGEMMAVYPSMQPGGGWHVKRMQPDGRSAGDQTHPTFADAYRSARGIPSAGSSALGSPAFVPDTTAPGTTPTPGTPPAPEQPRQQTPQELLDEIMAQAGGEPTPPTPTPPVSQPAAARPTAPSIPEHRVDPARLQPGGDIFEGGSSKTLTERGTVRAILPVNGQSWVQLGSASRGGEMLWAGLRRVVPIAEYQGATTRPARGHGRPNPGTIVTHRGQEWVITGERLHVYGDDANRPSVQTIEAAPPLASQPAVSRPVKGAAPKPETPPPPASRPTKPQPITTASPEKGQLQDLYGYKQQEVVYTWQLGQMHVLGALAPTSDGRLTTRVFVRGGQTPGLHSEGGLFSTREEALADLKKKFDGQVSTQTASAKVRKGLGGTKEWAEAQPGQPRQPKPETTPAFDEAADKADAAAAASGQEPDLPTDARQPWEMTRREFAGDARAYRIPKGSILASKPEDVRSGAALKDRSVLELQQLARVMGIPYTGKNKDALADRIVAAQKMKETLAGSTVDSLRVLPKKVLGQQLKLLTGGSMTAFSKRAMALQLMNWLAKTRRMGRSYLADTIHAIKVRKALEAGKPVPPEVMKDYPGLAKEFKYGGVDTPAPGGTDSPGAPPKGAPAGGPDSTDGGPDQGRGPTLVGSTTGAAKVPPQVLAIRRRADAFFDDLVLADARQHGYDGTDATLRTIYNRVAESGLRLLQDLQDLQETHSGGAFIKALVNLGGIKPWSRGDWGKKEREEFQTIQQGLAAQGYPGVRGPFRNDGKSLDEMLDRLGEQARTDFQLTDDHSIKEKLERIASGEEPLAFAQSQDVEGAIRTAGVRIGEPWWEDFDGSTDFNPANYEGTTLGRLFRERAQNAEDSNIPTYAAMLRTMGERADAGQPIAAGASDGMALRHLENHEFVWWPAHTEQPVALIRLTENNDAQGDGRYYKAKVLEQLAGWGTDPTMDSLASPGSLYKDGTISVSFPNSWPYLRSPETLAPATVGETEGDHETLPPDDLAHEAAVEENGTPAVAGVLTFRSGNQRAPVDLDAYVAAGKPVGVTAQMSPSVRAKVVQYAKAGHPVFVDSGAFGKTVVDEHGTPTVNIDFDKVLAYYDALIKEIGIGTPPHVVAPDVPPAKVNGEWQTFPRETMALQERYEKEIWHLDQLGGHVIVPVQMTYTAAGPDEDAFVHDMATTVEKFPGLLIGLPGNKGRVPPDILRAALTNINDEDLPFAGVHFLGVSEFGPQFESLVNGVREIFPDAVISTDANRTTAMIGTGRPLTAKIDKNIDRLNAGHADDEVVDYDLSAGLAGQFYGGEWDQFTPEELRHVFDAAGVTREQAELARQNGQLDEVFDKAAEDRANARIKEAVAAGNRGERVPEDTTPPDPIQHALWEIARDRAEAAGLHTQQGREEAITEKEQETQTEEDKKRAAIFLRLQALETPPSEPPAAPEPDLIIDKTHAGDQPRLPGAEGARKVGIADTKFPLPPQTGGEFTLGVESTPEAEARAKAEEAAKSPGLFGGKDDIFFQDPPTAPPEVLKREHVALMIELIDTLPKTTDFTSAATMMQQGFAGIGQPFTPKMRYAFELAWKARRQEIQKVDDVLPPTPAPPAAPPSRPPGGGGGGGGRGGRGGGGGGGRGPRPPERPPAPEPRPPERPPAPEPEPPPPMPPPAPPEAPPMPMEFQRLERETVRYGKYANVLVKDLWAHTRAGDPTFLPWLISAGNSPRFRQIAKYYTTYRPDYIQAQLEAEAPPPGPPGTPPIDPAAAITPEITAILDRLGIKAAPAAHGNIALTGNTRAYKDDIRAAGGRGFGGADGRFGGWHVPAGRLAGLVTGLGNRVGPGARPGQRGARYLRDRELGDLRKRADEWADTSQLPADREHLLAKSTVALLDLGRKIGIPQFVLDEQAEDVALASQAYQRGKKAFILASEPGSGKTYVLGGIIRELRRQGAKKIVYVTLRRGLIDQNKNDLAPYKIGDVRFVTYSALRKLPPQDTDALIFDEAHLIKNVKAIGGSRVAKAAKQWMAQAKFTVYASATPVENPTELNYMAPTGLFTDPFGDFAKFAGAFGATLKRRQDPSGDTYYTAEWQRMPTSDLDAAAAREWLRKEGIYTSRKIRLPEEQVDRRFVKVPASPEDAKQFELLSQAGRDTNNGAGGPNATMWMINFRKRLLEAAKVPQAIAMARDALARGRYPIIFVETKAERDLNIPYIIEQEAVWARDAAMARLAKEPAPDRVEYGLQPIGITAVLKRYMALSGKENIHIPPALQLIQQAFGADKVAVYAGDPQTAAGAARDLKAWREGTKPVMAATMAMGGTGLSLHDTVGDHQTSQFNVNLPWKATGLVQVAQRSTRYGLQGKAEVAWLFAHNIPLDRVIAARVGGHMADLGSTVHGVPLAGSGQFLDWNFNDPKFEEDEINAEKFGVPWNADNLESVMGLPRDQAEAVHEVLKAIAPRLRLIRGGTPGEATLEASKQGQQITEKIAELQGHLKTYQDKGAPPPVIEHVEAQIRALQQSVFFQRKDGPLYQQPAWHGSPHHFDEFSLQHIGTGEGAAAYGWGLYFAGKKSVAEYYRDKLTEHAGTPPPELMLKGEPVFDPRHTGYPLGSTLAKEFDWSVHSGLRAIRYVIEHPGWLYHPGPNEIAEIRQHFEEQKKQYLDAAASGSTVSGYPNEDLQAISEAKSALAVLDKYGKDLTIRQHPKPGRVYQVHIPDDEDFLSWDLPASQQSPKVQAALKAMGVEWEPVKPWTAGRYLAWTETGAFRRLWNEDVGIRATLQGGINIAESGDKEAFAHWYAKHQGMFPKGMVDPLGERIYEQVQHDILNARGRENLQLKPSDRPSYKVVPRLASEALAAHGIAGIRYLDGSSRNAGKGTQNYVVFDDKLVKIEKFYQQERAREAQGAIEFINGAIGLVHALKNPNASTALHEPWHLLRRMFLNRDVPIEERGGITDEEITMAEDWAGARRNPDGTTDWSWTKADGTKEDGPEEKYARGGEQYYRTGKAPIPALQPLFDKLARWMRQIYETVIGSPINVHITPAMWKLYDKIAILAAGMKDEPMARGPTEAAGGDVLHQDAPTVESRAFQRWFKDSKVVDKSGDPLVVYHHTFENFDTFKPGGFDPSLSGHAIWMTVEPDADEAPFAHQRTEAIFRGKGIDAAGDKISPYVVAAAHRGGPFEFDDTRQRISEAYDNVGRGMVTGENTMPVYASIQNPAIFRGGKRPAKGAEGPGSHITLMPDDKVEALRAKGYDGALSYDEKGKLAEVVAFDPTQVKSATGNRGTYSRKDANILYQRDDPPGYDAIAQDLTPQQREVRRVNDRESVVRIFRELPSDADWQNMALSGVAARGWYVRAARALQRVFGPVDMPRFVGVVAAFSPQAGVEENLPNALRFWVGWAKADRPTDPAAIQQIANRAVNGTAMPAYVHNLIRVVQSLDPAHVVLSGPKVHSFARNLLGHLDEFTGDGWMATFAGQRSRVLEGRIKAGGTNPGFRPGYLAFTAKARRAARALTARTGERWTPAEVQETIWAWTKTLGDDAKAAGMTAEDYLKGGFHTPDRIGGAPAFDTLLTKDPEIRSILDDTIYAERLQGLGRGRPAVGPGSRPARSLATGARREGEAPSPAEIRTARRLDTVTRDRAAAAEAKQLRAQAGEVRQQRPAVEPDILFQDPDESQPDKQGFWARRAAQRAQDAKDREPLVRSRDEEVEAAMQAAKGEAKTPWLKTVADRLKEIPKGTRHFPEIDPSKIDPDPSKATLRAAVHERLREQEGAARYGQTVAYNRINEILAPLTIGQIDTFARALILPDLLKDIKNGLYDGKDLPFKFKSVAAVALDLQDVNAAVARTPILKEQLKKRAELVDRVTRALVDEKLLSKDVLEDPDYYHRRVTEYQGKTGGLASPSNAGVRLRRHGWQMARIGGGDFNTAYHQSEHEWLAQAFADLKTKQTFDELDRLLNIEPKLRAKAKIENERQLGVKLAREAGIQEQGNDLFAGQAAVLSRSALKPFRQAMLRATRGILSALASGNYAVSDHFEDMAREMGDAYRQWQDDNEGVPMNERDPFDSTHPDWWAMVGDLAKHPETDGGKSALSALSAYNRKREYLETSLGGRYLNPRSAHDLTQLAPEGHKSPWQPEKGKYFYRATSIADRIADAVMAGEEHTVTKGDLRTITAVGGQKTTWIIPDWAKAALDTYGQNYTPTGWHKAVDSLIRGGVGVFKTAVMLLPWRIARVQANNLTGDADSALAFSGAILAHTKAASTFLYRTMYGAGKKMRRPSEAPTGALVVKPMAPEDAARVERLTELQVMDAGLSRYEIPGIDDLPGFQRLATADPVSYMRYLTTLSKPLVAYFGAARKATAYRENILRVAAYDYMLKQVKAGRKIYAASNRAKVTALQGDIATAKTEAAKTDAQERLAALLARDLIGDYGGVSSMTQWGRARHIPFFSFQEINLKRFVNLAVNTRYEEGGTSGRTATKLAGIAGRGIARRGLKWGLTSLISIGLVNAFMLGIAVWNALVYPEENRELGLQRRQQLHIIHGRNPDGSVATWRAEGAFSALLSWVDLQNWLNDAIDLARGDQTVSGKLKDMGESFVNKAYQSFDPFAKQGAEQVTGMKTYPDVFHRTPIRDRKEHFASMFALDSLYRKVTGVMTGLPIPEAPSAGLLSYRDDPGEDAYWAIRGVVGDYQAANDLGGGGGAAITQKANAAYYYKRALKWNLDAVADVWLDRYFELGGTKAQLAQSEAAGAPLASLNATQQQDFLASLTPKQQQMLDVADRWYADIYGEKTVRLKHAR